MAIVKHNGNNRNSLYLLYNLVSKDFKLKYRRSVLGVLWSVLNPLLQMIVMVLVFTNIFRFDIENFPVYLILGQVLMTLVTDATTNAMSSILDAAPLIKKIYIEKIIFPTEKNFFAVVNFALSLIAVAGVMIWFRIPPHLTMLYIPLLLIYVVVFSLGLSYFLSAVAVYFRDTMHLWTVFTTLWFYLTPVFWPIEALAQNGISWMYNVILFNPMYHYLLCFRDVMMYNTWPSLTENLICIGFAAVTFAIGLLVFRKLEKKFILYI